MPVLTGEERGHTWSGWQPQAILRYEVSPDLNLYASYSRGFRSGGFNQTGVGVLAAAAGFVGVGDMSRPSTPNPSRRASRAAWATAGSASTARSIRQVEERLLLRLPVDQLDPEPRQYSEVRYTGFDADTTFRVTDDFQVNAGFGYNRQLGEEILRPATTAASARTRPWCRATPSNVSAQYTPPISSTMNALFRVDYNRIGKTFFWESDTVPAGTPDDHIAQSGRPGGPARPACRAETGPAALWAKERAQQALQRRILARRLRVQGPAPPLGRGPDAEVLGSFRTSLVAASIPPPSRSYGGGIGRTAQPIPRRPVAGGRRRPRASRRPSDRRRRWRGCG